MTFNRRTLYWILIVAAAAGIAAGHARLNEAASEANDGATMAILTLQAKILAAGEAAAAGTMKRELPKLELSATSPGPARAQAVLYGLLTGDDREFGRERARRLLDRHQDTLTDPGQLRLHRLVRAVIDDPAGMAADDREYLESQLGWFAEMILSRDLPADAPERTAPRRSAYRLLAVMVVILVLAGIGVLLGCGLLILAMIQKADDRLPLRMGKPAHGGCLYLEAFTVYIWLFFLLEILPALLGFARPWLSFGGLAVLSLVGLFWPVLRGLPGETAFRDLGLYRGQGVLKEIGSGLAGYVAVLPVIAIGFAVTLVLSMYSRAEPTGHPVVVWIAYGGTSLRLAVLLLASGFAPFFEEAMFRGALFRDLRRFLGPVLSAGIMGVLFAAIHPQGLITVPALAGLAVGFALIREWRGSLIAPMAAHALHNGLLVGLMWLAFI
jgi:membrane protease YdiL (CAAX protease family)